MLKIWKQTWKQEDGLRQQQSGQDIDLDDQLSGTSSDRPSADVVTAVPPDSGDSLLVPVETPDKNGKKRPRNAELSNDSMDPPLKKSKLEHAESRDLLRDHLPEILETDFPAASSLSVSSFEDQILDQAKRVNTIGVLASMTSVNKILAEYLTWAIETERCRRLRTAPRPRRSALLVVDEDSAIDKQVSSLEEYCNLTIGTYTEAFLATNNNPWPDLLQQDLVVVSANALLDCLLRSTLAISHVHVLVINEAQSIKDQDLHPTIRVMNDFYRVTDALSRPKIFAIATPPPDRKFHFDSGMLTLETVLDARVYGVSGEKRAEILALPDSPTEIVVLYDPPVRTVETRLFRELLQLDPNETLFRYHFRAARHALIEVGSCAADLIWRRALKEIEASVVPIYEEDEDDQDQSGMSSDRRRSKIRDVVKNWAFSMPNLHSNSRGFNITPKFLKLVKVLKSCEPYGDSFRGVVFVQKKAAAHVLVDLIRTLGDQLAFIRPCAVVGHGPSVISEQQRILRAFAKGSYNLLVATKSAEDLEMPKASIVIRFDLFESHVSNAYVRARSRGRESHLVFMVEKSNDIHRRILSQITQLSADLQKWTENVGKDPRSSIPPHTLRETIDPYLSDSDCEDDNEDYIKDPTTSGRIRPQDATTAVYRYAARHGPSNHPLFEFKEVEGSLGNLRTYVCSIHLPLWSLDTIIGLPAPSMAHARRSACYQACVELFKRGRLDYTLFLRHSNVSNILPPQYTEGGIEKEHLAAGTRSYPRKRPDFWANTESIALGSQLYPTIISTDYTDDVAQPHWPLLMITSRPLPKLSSFKLFFSGVQAVINFISAAPFRLNDAQLRDLHMYTIRMCRSISNRPFVCSLEDMPFFFCPLGPTWRKHVSVDMVDQDLPCVAEHIPWHLVSLAAKSWVVALQADTLETLAEDIRDAVIQDRWVEFTRRYDAVRMRPDLSPRSKPEDSPREAGYENLVEYCKDHRKGFEGLQNYEQPLIEVSKVPAVLNRLNPTSRPLTASTKHPAKYLIPELCAKFTIPASTFRMALLLPSITRRLDDILLVKELNAKFFDHSIAEHLLHAAVSAPAAGMEFDYERLELLGDAFLKYLSSIYVFVTNPAQHEGALHVARQRIISNKSLLHNASQAGLPPYIQSKPFTLRQWQPTNFVILSPPNPPDLAKKEDNDSHLVKDEKGRILRNGSKDAGEIAFGKGHITMTSDAHDPGKHLAPVPDQGVGRPSLEESVTPISEEPTQSIDGTKLKKKSKKQRQLEEINNQMLGDKAIADVAEAIIGAAYISGGRECALRAAKALKIPIPHIDRWSDFSRKVLAPPPDVTAKLRPGSIEAVESIIGHKFNRPHLLAQALTHASIQGYETTSYERLEFIGDAILDFMVIRYIYDRDSQLSPGALTLLKGAMVANSTLAAVSVWAGLHEHLLFESYTLASSMQVYADELKMKQKHEYDLAEKEGRSPGQYWLEIEPPKALSDVVESIIGAIYISDNFSPVGGEALFDNVLRPFYDGHITLKTLSHHPTKILFELFQAQGCQQFQIVKEKEYVPAATRCDVIVHDVILASATDTTVTFATRRASLFALDALEGDADFLTRTCDCRSNAQTKKAQKCADESLSLLHEDEEELAVESVLTKVEGDSGRVNPIDKRN